MLEEKVNLSVISPRMIPSLWQIFELGQPNEEVEKEVGEQADHALSAGHLVLFQGFEVPGIARSTDKGLYIRISLPGLEIRVES